MGKEKQTTVSQPAPQTQQVTPQPTPEESELNRLALERARAAQPGMMEAQAGGLNLINQLLTGQALPGYLGGLPGGISPEITGEMAQEAVRDLGPAFQTQGILESGVAPVAAARTAGDIRRMSAEFNIGNLLNLLNLAVGGQAQIQAPILGQAQAVGQRLAGLRPITTTVTGGGGTTTTTGMNPFLRSFQTTAGQTLGSPSFSVGPFGF